MGERAINNILEEQSFNIPLREFAESSDIKDGSIYLAHLALDESSYIAGPTLSINGGIFMK